MMTPKIETLLNALGNRPILVWGARMTGIGFFRFTQKHGKQVIGFVDSDRSLVGKATHGAPIYPLSELGALREQFKDLIVVVAVSLKEDEIVKALGEFGLDAKDYLRYSDFSSSFFTVDIAGCCNLKCPSCAHVLPGFENPKGFMTQEDFFKITEKIMAEVELVSHICLYSWGEPFLHPDLGRFVERIHELGVAAAVSTNLCIESASRIERVIQAAPDYLKISLSGYYPAAYNSTHTGGNVDLVKSNLYRLRYYIDKRRAPVFVDVNYHVYKNNCGEDLKRMRALCEELGFVLSTCYANVTPVERLIDYAEGKIDPITKELDELLLVDIGQGLEIGRSFPMGVCRFLTNQTNINWDRSVPLCCVAFDRHTALVSDDYLADSLEEIALRKENHPVCKKCLKFGIPQYLLGVNQDAWERAANQTVVEKQDPGANPCAQM
jgi:MoaA/NifB/PqqE/SkfB family radical SAM enzyme